MRMPGSENPHTTDGKDDPNRMIYVSALVAGVLFALGYWATLLVAIFTGDFTFGGLLVTVLVSASAGLGLAGWRRQRVSLSWAALALLLTAMALSQAVAS
ncbi:hypothetical protein [Streptomyces sp. V3I7]|uniref:hypothetical protein n=1 Tax=Streptomyces sp. V3I7 TaxID=3042278 RepID=UPI00278AB764|nr:hypothetical protein [Streptomyces sp. V3I7]MDQ0990935.1 putative membrane protein [Streptomyces sp. V3I7]